MITVKTFVFNPFYENTYLLFDETCECVIIDPGCMADYENEELSKFIADNMLRPLRLFNTHAHVDHVAGNNYVSSTYKIGLEVHRDSLPLLHTSKDYAAAFGFNNIVNVEPTAFLKDGDIIYFGNSALKVLYTPGHADGSVCFYAEKDKFVIVGDVLFNGSIGRTDFPTGDFDLLMDSIRTKLFTLPGDTLVYSGHGLTTTIGFEEENNPFLI